LEVSPDGSLVFVTGESVGDATALDYATLAYDATSGARRWTSRYSGPSFDDRATSLGVSPDGTAVFVTGVSSGTSTDDYADRGL
jgi:DNA-binding beta-propeller fold protein YncE